MGDFSIGPALERKKKGTQIHSTSHHLKEYKTHSRYDGKLQKHLPQSAVPRAESEDETA